MRQDMNFVVAIDGTAGSGKGTIGKAISQHYNFRYLDTGLLYRAVAFNLSSLSGDLGSISERSVLKAIRAIDEHVLQLKELRENEVGERASLIATNPFVRQNLLMYQRDFASQNGGTVLDGRDIGTVVCPDADVKIFVDALESIRAIRRVRQYEEQNLVVSYAEVLEDIRKRDEKDRNRKISPMVPAKDALLLDSSKMTVNESLDIVILRIDAELNKN